MRILRQQRLLYLIFFLSFFSGCFGGVKNTGKVKGYESGRVLTKKGFYQVGQLPSTWYQIKLGKALVAFRNDAYLSTLSTDSYCKQAYNDSNLQQLTQHLLGGLQKIEVESEKDFMLNNRGARLTQLRAKLDGLPVKIAIVVIKKNWCLFDFFLVSSPEKYPQAFLDFQTFYQGFRYTGEDQ